MANTCIGLNRLGKSQIPLRYLGRRQARSWLQTCSKLEFGLSCTVAR